MKKLIAMLMLMPLMALAYETSVGGITWSYDVSNGKATVTRANPASGSINIPSSLGGYPVTSIGDSAFYGCSGLTSVVISEGVTSIGDSAFYGCSGLTSVVIPSSVTSIKNHAFSGCSGLTSVTIPSSVASIGDSAFSAFSGCSGLTAISVDASNPFYSSQSGILYNKTKSELILCPKGKTGAVAIPSGVTSIGNHAFFACSELTSVTIPSSVTSIGNVAFAGCCGLTSVVIPSGVASIGDQAFHNCSGLTSVTIPSSVTGIGNDAFGGCSGLTSVTIPSSVTSIGYSVFSYCSNLTSVVIPSSVASIGDGAFLGCGGLTSISVDANNPAYNSQSGILYNKTKSKLICCPGGKTGAVAIPSGVTSVGDFAFWGCSGLTSVTIPSSVTSIGDYAFRGCSGLTSVTIPSSVASIGVCAFEECTGLMSVTISDGVTSIGNYAFSRCSGLTSVTIPSSVTSIGYYAFDGCSYLKTIYVSIGDTYRIRLKLSTLGLDVDGIRFVEIGTEGEGEDEDCGGDCSPADEGDEGSGVGVKDPFDGNEKHVFNGLVRDKKKSPCGLIQVTTDKATKKGVKVSGFVMLEDGKKVTMKAVTVAVEKKQLNVSTTVGKLGSISLTIGGNGFAGTLGDKKVASEKLDEDAGVLKTTVKVTYLDAATGKLKTKNMTLGGITVGGDAVGTLSQKNSSARAFQAETECDSCRPN